MTRMIFGLYALILLFLSTALSTALSTNVWAGDETLLLRRGIPSAKNGPDGAEYLPLGIDEALVGPLYRYHAFTKPAARGDESPLVQSTAEFTPNRWRLKNDGQLVFRFHLDPILFGDGVQKSHPLKFLGAMLTLTLDDFRGGRCIAEWERDGESWSKIGEATGSGWIQPILGADWSLEERPESLWFRFRAEKTESDADFAVIGVGLEAMLDRGDFTGQGGEVVARIVDESSEKAASNGDRSIDADPLFLTADNRLAVRLTNNTAQEAVWNPTVRISPAPTETAAVTLASNASVNRLFSCRVEPNRRRSTVVGHLSQTLEIPFDIPAFFIVDYTSEIAGLSGSTGGVSLSWTDASRRVPKNSRVVEIHPAAPILIEAAKNDFESFQIVVRGGENSAQLSVCVSELTGPDNATLESENIQLRRAFYHEVKVPTDGSAAAGFYPDALVPLEGGMNSPSEPLTVGAHENLPLWITVRVPNDAAAGDWHGQVRLRDSDGTLDAQIPFTLHVWNFALPKKNRIRTAFGLSFDTIFRYHRCTTDEEKRIVLDKYLRSFADHRISPYFPTPFAHYRTAWQPDGPEPSCALDFTEFDRELGPILEQYPFTDFRLDISGLRHDEPIAGYAPGSDDYEAMYADYLRKLEQHLESKGWLDRAYCYWTDEPEEKDYDFVTDGFALLSKNAPKIRRMLTEEPSDKLAEQLAAKGSNIDIWCPVSHLYQNAEAQKRENFGEQMWWYVCCGPVAPYCTEFTDHPALELRLWLWQTYQRGISGVLIWTTNFWTNDTFFPETPQNPYLDPMCYATGPGGSRGYYGNGDGRFIYPPLSALDANASERGACLDGPVEGIRWEMLREGIEDYEMLTMLSDAYAKNKERLSEAERLEIEPLLSVPETISRSMTSFADDPNVLYEQRRKIARALEQLQK